MDLSLVEALINLSCMVKMTTVYNNLWLHNKVYRNCVSPYAVLNLFNLFIDAQDMVCTTLSYFNLLNMMGYKATSNVIIVVVNKTVYVHV